MLLSGPPRLRLRGFDHPVNWLRGLLRPPDAKVSEWCVTLGVIVGSCVLGLISEFRPGEYLLVLRTSAD